MRADKCCYDCLLRRHIDRANRSFTDESIRKQYIKRVREILDGRGDDDSPPYLGIAINEAYRELGGKEPSFSELKREYNLFVMGMEAELSREIENAEDPLKRAMIFARVGNYIDFGAVKDVSKEKFIELLEASEKDDIPAETWKAFHGDMAKAKTFLMLHDNCGEIVLDKLLFRELRKKYPDVRYYSMVRGGEAGNDATIEDADFCGLSREVDVITNGLPVPSTIYRLLPEEAKALFDSADVILSKGQANFEALHGIDRNIYYSFLCKCALFTELFNVERFTGMFVK